MVLKKGPTAFAPSYSCRTAGRQTSDASRTTRVRVPVERDGRDDDNGRVGARIGSGATSAKSCPGRIDPYREPERPAGSTSRHSMTTLLTVDQCPIVFHTVQKVPLP